jgi:regulator of protease activity HflC (stomatin/prohibitin superfamily)
MLILSGMVTVGMLTQCTVIKPGFNGVLNRPLGEGLKTDKVYTDGFAWKWPWNRMIKYNVQIRSYQEKMDILTSDELHTNLTLSVILKPNPEELPLMILEIGEDYYASNVRPEFYSVARSNIANFNYEELSAQSTQIENEIFDELVDRLEGKHLVIDRVTLDHIMYSPMVTNATDEKLATKQQVEQKDFEIQIAEKDAEIQRILARGQKDAQIIIDQGLTQKYLQFKSLEIQEMLSDSENAKFYFIPIGEDGLPVIVDTGRE